jgi:hypothetical protein
MEVGGMGRFRKLLVSTVGALSLIGAGSTIAGAHDGGTLVQFDSMTPVTGAAVGTVNDRGLVGGGKAWMITSGSGAVDRQGDLEVQVTGLVLVPTGANPITQFKATLSCLTPHGVVNVSTELFAASATGDSTISGRVSLPRPCMQPIVFVGNAGGAWFAMSNPTPHGDEDGD